MGRGAGPPFRRLTREKLTIDQRGAGSVYATGVAFGGLGTAATTTGGWPYSDSPCVTYSASNAPPAQAATFLGTVTGPAPMQEELKKYVEQVNAMMAGTGMKVVSAPAGQTPWGQPVPVPPPNDLGSRETARQYGERLRSMGVPMNEVAAALDAITGKKRR